MCHKLDTTDKRENVINATKRALRTDRFVRELFRKVLFDNREDK